jgi:Flp pilus assembly protein TadB
MPEDSLERLEGFARLFAKSLDLIVTALSSNRTIPHAIFRIRDHFAREISDCELPFVLEHVEALVDVTKREQGDSEALTA